MSPQTQPAVAHSLSSLERFAPEILEQVAFFTAEDRLLGPPSDLLALLMTSKTINWAISPENNNSLYKKVFALKFDTAAASRRLGPRWLTNRCLASELRHRFKALRRIRGGAIDGPMLQRDLWTVFLILLEHDHKNMLQLTEWAKTNQFVNLVVERWLIDGYGPEFGEDAGGLVCTIIWELVREADLTESWRRRLQNLLYTHVLCGYRLSSFHASEEFFVVQGHPEEVRQRVQGRPPVSTQAEYYGHTITIAAPPLAHACFSVFMVAAQPNVRRYTPGYMREYVGGRTFSRRMDDEWYRLVMCHSITDIGNPLGGARITPSSLIGSWAGTTLVPDFIPFGAFVRSDQRENPFNISTRPYPAEIELREHHCLDDEPFVMPGRSDDDVADNPLNAWLPEGCTFNEHNDVFEIYDPDQDHESVYETYRTDAENPYASGYEPEERWITGEGEEREEPGAQIVDDPVEAQGLLDDPSYIDEDGWEDVVDHCDSGVKDIILTGTMKTADREHRLLGRIRLWDALIILLRLPSSPNDPPEVGWIFRGYVRGERHIIGRWKQTMTPVGEIGWEGGFMFTKNS